MLGTEDYFKPTDWSESLHKSHNDFAVGVIVLKLATSVNQITKRLVSMSKILKYTCTSLMGTDNQIFMLVDEMTFKYTQCQSFQRS